MAELNLRTALMAGLATIMAALPVEADAQVGETVAQFYKSCQAENGRVDGRCDSYIEGAADTLAAFGKGGAANGICGRGYNEGELSRIFMAWVPGNRQVWGLPRLAGVMIALREQYPCRR
ncbi:hypothetical protein H5J25_19155 (plasmid) [Sphingomonas aliaeris]|uniref:Rap1a immunity protein domain-containing protein n=1 Tax=Sphingomonas aliaeris TaxID=2759526 RepID=A0A974S6Z2_9SPHN|nr:Rap1a/Tai family immunity protein [Sphingomonas aliaeris]QQV79360.1 hypothetical protein H5J25_19155 [Sphingomonas aliaeris]